MRKYFGKYVSAFISTSITIMMITQFTYAAPSLSQNELDIPSDWAKVEIEKANELNLIPERIQGTYKSNITREEFSELVVKLYEALSGKKGIAEKENPFTDTKNPKVNIANSLGIVNGIGGGKFAPNNTITREEVSTILYNTLKVSKPENNYLNIHNYTFADQNMISPWAQDAVIYLYGAGVIGGVGNDQFNPSGNTQREEAIALTKRMYDKFSVDVIDSRDNLALSRGATFRERSVTKLKNFISQEMGKPYKWGGTGPDGYDCSGLLYAIFDKLGISLPRTSESQSTAGAYVSKEDLVYGDLVFFARDGANVNHAGIYVGNGEFVHSPQTGEVVKTTTLMSGYYERTYYTARRVLP